MCTFVSGGVHDTGADGVAPCGLLRSVVAYVTTDLSVAF
nr:MAG TPA: hypothetical protein [Caudoviricetes sp.]